MIFAKILGFAVLALVAPAIAAPINDEAGNITVKNSNRTSVVASIPTTAGEVTAKSFVGGICSCTSPCSPNPIPLLFSCPPHSFQVLTFPPVHNLLVQECAQPDKRRDDPNSWYTLTSTTIHSIIDGAGHPFFLKLYKAFLDNYHGYNIYGFPQVLTVEFGGRELFKYNGQSWDEFTQKNDHSAWCERGEWTMGPLDCMKDKSTDVFRVS